METDEFLVKQQLAIVDAIPTTVEDFSNLTKQANEYDVFAELIKENKFRQLIESLPKHWLFINKTENRNVHLPLCNVLDKVVHYLPRDVPISKFVEHLLDKQQNVRVDCTLATVLLFLIALQLARGPEWIDKFFAARYPTFFTKHTITLNSVFGFCFKIKQKIDVRHAGYNLKQQEQLLKTLPVGSWCYIRGCRYWDMLYTAVELKNLNCDSRLSPFQGENTIYAGNGKFICFLRDTTELDATTKYDAYNYDYIVECLQKRGPTAFAKKTAKFLRTFLRRGEKITDVKGLSSVWYFIAVC